MAGFGLLGLALLVGRRVGGTAAAMAAAAATFVPVWLALCALNAFLGIARAGRTPAEEAPAFLATLALPAAAALLVRWRLTR